MEIDGDGLIQASAEYASGVEVMRMLHPPREPVLQHASVSLPRQARSISCYFFLCLDIEEEVQRSFQWDVASPPPPPPARRGSTDQSSFNHSRLRSKVTHRWKVVQSGACVLQGLHLAGEPEGPILAAAPVQRADAHRVSGHCEFPSGLVQEHTCKDAVQRVPELSAPSHLLVHVPDDGRV